MHSPVTIPTTAAAGLLGTILPVNVGGVQWGIHDVRSFPFVTGVAKKTLATFLSPLWAAILAALGFLTLRSALLRRDHSLHLTLQVGVGLGDIYCVGSWAADCSGEEHSLKHILYGCCSHPARPGRPNYPAARAQMSVPACHADMAPVLC